MKLVLDYIDEIKLRLARYDIVFNDDILILTYLNRARRQVQLITSKLLPERYGDIYTMQLDKAQIQLQSSILSNFASVPIKVYEVPLPNNLIDIAVCVLHWNNEDTKIVVECRETTKEELFNSTRSSFTTPTIHSPIYCWERDITNASFYKLLIAGLEYTNNGIAASWLDNHNVFTDVYYVYGIDDLELVDTDFVIPDIYYEYVIYYAMLYCSQYQNAKESIKLEIQNMIGLIKGNYELSPILPSEENKSGKI